MPAELLLPIAPLLRPRRCHLIIITCSRSSRMRMRDCWDSLWRTTIVSTTSARTTTGITLRAPSDIASLAFLEDAAMAAMPSRNTEREVFPGAVMKYVMTQVISQCLLASIMLLYVLRDRGWFQVPPLIIANWYLGEIQNFAGCCLSPERGSSISGLHVLCARRP